MLSYYEIFAFASAAGANEFSGMTPPSPVSLPAGLAASFDTIRPLGAGGMGAVWLVGDRFLDRLVALKVLHADQSGPEERERFLREARTSARLEHPHIIDVYRTDETDGVVWFSMRDLAERDARPQDHGLGELLCPRQHGGETRQHAKVPVFSAAPLIAAAGAAVLGSAAVMIWYRWLFCGALRETYEELGGLLKSVEQQLIQQRHFSGERGVLSSATGTTLSVPR